MLRSLCWRSVTALKVLDGDDTGDLQTSIGALFTAMQQHHDLLQEHLRILQENMARMREQREAIRGLPKPRRTSKPA